MTGWQYLAWIVPSLLVLGVCALGAAWLISLARQAWREMRDGIRERHEKRTAGHLLRQIRSGKLGI